MLSFTRGTTGQADFSCMGSLQWNWVRKWSNEDLISWQRREWCSKQAWQLGKTSAQRSWRNLTMRLSSVWAPPGPETFQLRAEASPGSILPWSSFRPGSRNSMGMTLTIYLFPPRFDRSYLKTAKNTWPTLPFSGVGCSCDWRGGYRLRLYWHKSQTGRQVPPSITHSQQKTRISGSSSVAGVSQRSRFCRSRQIVELMIIPGLSSPGFIINLLLREGFIIQCQIFIFHEHAGSSKSTMAMRKSMWNGEVTQEGRFWPSLISMTWPSILTPIIPSGIIPWARGSWTMATGEWLGSRQYWWNGQRWCRVDKFCHLVVLGWGRKVEDGRSARLRKDLPLPGDKSMMWLSCTTSLSWCC